jgi:hypothetical protein
MQKLTGFINPLTVLRYGNSYRFEVQIRYKTLSLPGLFNRFYLISQQAVVPIWRVNVLLARFAAGTTWIIDVVHMAVRAMENRSESYQEASPIHLSSVINLASERRRSNTGSTLRKDI